MNQPMSKKERVRAAIAGEEVDQITVSVWLNLRTEH